MGMPLNVPVVDLSGEPFVLPDAAASSGEEAPMLRGLTPTPFRVPLLVVCRESAEYDTVLLQGLVEHTLSYLGDRPCVPRARALGITPLTDATVPGVDVVHLSYGKARAVLFAVEGDYFLYSMTSAYARNASGDNDWTRLVSAVLTALRPEMVQVASLSRLVRSFDGSALLLHAISKHVDVVRAGNAAMVMRGEGSETGQLMWSLLAMVAASERTLIVQRLTAGVVAKYKRGEWVKGLGAVPLGYRLDPDSKLLVPDPAQAEALRTAWVLMADSTLTNWQVVRALGDLGVTTKVSQDRYGDEATVSDLAAPDTFMRQVKSWVPLYRTGSHVTRWANPFEGATHIAGMPVHKANGREELHFAYDFGRPDLPEHLIDAGLAGRAQRVHQRPERGGAAAERVPALTQYAWIQDGLEYWLVAGPRGSYELRVRPANEAATDHDSHGPAAHEAGEAA